MADGKVAGESMVRIVATTADPAALTEEGYTDLVDSMAVVAVASTAAAGTGKNKLVMHQMFG